jgi:hypothetical protein
MPRYFDVTVTGRSSMNIGKRPNPEILHLLQVVDQIPPHPKLLAASKLEQVQRRAARYVTNHYHNISSVSAILNHLQWRMFRL